jgi:hypothetical protein
MAKQLILFSPSGERLVIDMAAGTVESVLSEVDDAETYLVVEPSAAKPAGAGARPHDIDFKPKKPPRAPPDIKATLIVGEPTLPPSVVVETVSGPQDLETLADRFPAMSEDGVIAIILGPADGG